ncbi:MAG TPA: RidA family protein [Methylorubrum populi]|uniref:RidA family protein n=1 Tax=Methylorubrum populi TaxID=223967 RepID=A0A921E1B5_9HYPH|nr:RidA family protein [Methylorubrum populi]
MTNATTIERYETGPRMSQAVAHGELVFLAGQVAADVVGTGVTAQTQQILEQIDRLLLAAGSDKSRILSATIYLADIAGFAEMNAAWDAWVDRSNPPARATVEARLVAPEYLVEIAVTAARSKP